MTFESVWKWGGRVFWVGFFLFFAVLMIVSVIDDYSTATVEIVTANVGGRLHTYIHTTDGRPGHTPNKFAGRSPDGKAIIETFYTHTVSRVNYPVNSRVLLGSYDEKAWYRIESVSDTEIRLVRIDSAL